MQILENFGFEPIFFVAQIINFLILAAIFKKFLYKPVLKLLKDREKSIASGLEDAELAKKTLENAAKEKDDIIKAATIEAEKIISETKKSTDGLRIELLEHAKTEAEKIISDAKETANTEFQKAKEEARNISLDLSKKILDKILTQIFTKQEKNKIIERNIHKFQKV